MFACVAAILCALEPSAYACLSNVNCSGTTPVCGLSLTCRACESDLECGAPLSGDVCATSGSQQGACVQGGPVSDASIATCAADSDCGVGLVCDLGSNSTSACVVGCHALPGGGDTCPIGEHCDIASTTIGVCLSNTGTDAGTSTGACSTDSNCVPGLVCVAPVEGGAPSCIVGCHVTGAGDTCPTGSECNVTGGGTGVCLGLLEADASTTTETCAGDSQCGAGLVCDEGLSGGAECAVGCHAEGDGGADTCAISTHCSVFGGGLGICLPNTASGSGTENGSCSLDSDCVEGLVCDHALDGGAQCVFGCHANGVGSDTCPSGAHCSNVGGGVGVCLENGTSRLGSPGDASSEDGSNGSGSSGGSDSGGGGSSSGGSSGGGSGGNGDGGSGSESDSSGGASSSGGGTSADASGESDAFGGDGQSGMSGDGSSSGDATLASDGASGDGGADSGATDGYMEGAGCSCSSAPGAGATNEGLVFGAMWAVIGIAVVGRSKSRKANRSKKDGRHAR